MDPLSVTAGVIGIAATTLHSISRVESAISNIKHAPEAISSVRSELQSVCTIVATLQRTCQDPALINDDLKSILQGVPINATLQNCAKICDEFHTALTKWTKHSTEERLHWLDRLRTGYVEKSTIREFIAEVGSCKVTISLVLDTAIFLNACRASPHTTTGFDDMENKLKAVQNDAESLICRHHSAPGAHVPGTDGGQQQHGFAGDTSTSQTTGQGVQFQNQKDTAEYPRRTVEKSNLQQIYDNIRTAGDATIGKFDVSDDTCVNQQFTNITTERGGRAVIGVGRIGPGRNVGPHDPSVNKRVVGQSGAHVSTATSEELGMLSQHPCCHLVLLVALPLATRIPRLDVDSDIKLMRDVILVVV
ncbi:hypothetical protein BDV25DRAFT_136743 [Aspergillus avenaceus]|uniref:Azaphilone pigments biosynthesis cluster protein L N-terminal domain-containing protein n=1 Tax=Aspergillus avenaceus TaxID=36643 RepID=A0A5N6U4X5_ASPAV|nr:hypothetical protein BDV25DRAFT_136743 [Aspergillus avenaceus]